MLEDTNSLDGAHLTYACGSITVKLGQMGQKQNKRRKKLKNETTTTKKNNPAWPVFFRFQLLMFSLL